jgi:hypothetical protein
MKSNGPDGKVDTEDDIESPIHKCIYRFPKNNKAPDKVEGK